MSVDTPGGGPAEWQTPPSLFAALNRRYQFDYDAFASHENALTRCLADRYSTLEGTFQWLDKHSSPEQGLAPGEVRPAKVHSAEGLGYDWDGLRVFLNPPFSRGLLEACLAKAVAERERAEIIVALIPAAVSTRWWQAHVAPFADVTFLSRRVRFIDPLTGKSIGSPRFDSAIAVFRQELCW